MTLLLQELSDPDPWRQQQTLSALGRLGPKAASAIPQIVALVYDTNADETVRKYAIYALSAVGRGDVRAVTALKDIIAGGTGTLRDAAIIAAGELGPDLEALLRSILETGDRSGRRSAAQALAKMGAAQAETIEALVNVLKTADRDVQQKTAEALGSARTNVNRAVQGLLDFIARDPAGTDANSRLAAAAALETLAETARKQADPIAVLPALERARDILMQENTGESKKYGERIQTKILLIEKENADNIISQLAELARNSPLALAFSILFSLYVSIISILFFFFYISPEMLLRFREILGPATADPSTGRRKFAVGQVFWLGTWTSHPRVLDAWVARRLGRARNRFEQSEAVRQLGPRIPLPVAVGDQLIEDFGPETLRPLFNSTLIYLLIHGEGGIGKTSLACQIARWAISMEPTSRLTPRPMIPVVIDDDVDDYGATPFLDAINRRLQYLIDSPEPIAHHLLLALLRSRRVLVIVDRFSELNPTTRRMIEPHSPVFPVNALVVTSRLSEDFGIDVTSLRPFAISPERLSIFLLDYLKSVGKADLITDQLLSEARQNLAALVQDTPVTVLLAKLYADQLVHLITTGARNLDSLPRSIPELMLKYVNLINDSIRDDRLPAHKVHGDLKAISWESIQAGFYPSAVRITRLLEVLGDPDAESRLAYVHDRLSLTVTVDPPGDALRLRLDPLAEFLAALHISETYASDAEDWFALFDSIRGQPPERPANGGFIRALASACSHYRDELRLPGYVLDSVGLFAGWLAPATDASSGSHH